MDRATLHYVATRKNVPICNARVDPLELRHATSSIRPMRLVIELFDN